jgi:dethiobiotin synthetase
MTEREPRHPLVLLAGTGTEVGKTHVASALLRAWGETARVVGYKPVETGVGQGEEGDDARTHAGASTFHVKHPVFRQTYRDPVSPHLAARREGAPVDVARLAEQAGELRLEAAGLVVELAGGLFTPLGEGVFNVDLAKRLAPTRVVLVAPDRLGVLHDVAATFRAAAHEGLVVHGVVLSEAAQPDPSSGTNGAEIARALGARVLATFPRARGDDPRTREAARELLAALRVT